MTKLTTEWTTEWLRIPKGGTDSKIKLYPELNHLDQKVRIILIESGMYRVYVYTEVFG